MPEVGLSGLRHRIVVPVDDFVQVAGCHLGYLVKLLKVIRPLTAGKGWQGDGGQVAHCHLILRSVLNDFCTKVGAVDCAEVLLVGLAVRVILVQHVRRAGLHLRLKDAEPKLLCLDHLAALALPLEACVQFLELLAPYIHQPLTTFLVVGLVWAEESPIQVVLYPSHEEIWNPEPVEEIPGALLLLAVILPQLQEVEDICVLFMLFSLRPQGAMP